MYKLGRYHHNFYSLKCDWQWSNCTIWCMVLIAHLYWSFISLSFQGCHTIIEHPRRLQNKPFFKTANLTEPLKIEEYGLISLQQFQNV